MSLTREEALRLQAEDLTELARVALADRETFVFALRLEGRGDDDGGDGDGDPTEVPGWGGEVRVCVNQNLVLHFVPAFSADMREVGELPQLAVMPDSERAGEDEVHTCEGTGELEPFDGVVFWVGREQYADMIAEMQEVAAAFGERAILPDKLFGASRFVHLITERVLPHEVARKERPFDFTRRRY